MSNTIIQVKRSSASGNIPDAANISHGELALNYADGKLYYKTDLNTVDAIYTQNLYETFNVGGTLLIPTNRNEILTIARGNGISISANTTTDTITIDETLSPIINTKFNISGGTITGNVDISGNIVPLTNNVYFLGSSTNKWHSLFVGPGSVDIDGIVLSNTSSSLQIGGSTDLVLPAANLPSLNTISTTINLAYAHANSAYDTANLKFNLSGGTITGDVNVAGNLIVQGTTFSVNTTTLSVSDSLIALAVNNVTDIVDIGFYGHYANTPNLHTGLIRDASDGIYYLFDNLQDEPTSTINIANVRIATVNANLISTSINLRGMDPLDHANAAYNTANLKYNSSGGTISGDVTVTGNITTHLITINGTTDLVDSIVYSGNTTFSTSAQTAIDSFSSSLYGSAKYIVQVKDVSTGYRHASEILLVWESTNVNKVEYAVVTTNGEQGTFDSDINGGNVRLLFNPINSNTRNVRFVRNVIKS